MPAAAIVEVHESEATAGQAETHQELLDEIERRRVQLQVEHAVRERVLNEIVERSSELTPGGIDISPSELLLLQEICRSGNKWVSDSVHEVCRLLADHRITTQLRKACGDPKILEAAGAEVDVARENERTTKAAIADLEVGQVTDEPVLAAQINRLTERLRSLTNQRLAAERRVDRLRQRRRQLRARAPKFLADQVRREWDACQQGHPTCRRLREVQRQIRSFEQYLRIRAHGLQTEDLGFAKVYVPDAVITKPDHRPVVDRQKLAQYIEQLRETELPALRAECDQLAAEVRALKAEIEKPVTDWMQNGLVLE
jgi:hypothetical protein